MKKIEWKGLKNVLPMKVNQKKGVEEMLLSDKIEFSVNYLYRAKGNISYWQNNSIPRWYDSHELLCVHNYKIPKTKIHRKSGKMYKNVFKDFKSVRNQ